MVPNKTEGKTIKSAETVLDIFECIRELEVANVSELARRLDYSKSTIYYYLRTLEQRRYLIKDDGHYRLGLQLLNLGANARHQHELFDIVEPKTDELAAETDAVAHAAVEDSGMAVFLYRAAHGSEAETYVGQETDLHCTAYGKSMLAYMPSESVNRILGRDELPRRTEHTVTRRNELERQLKTIREIGIAYAEEEYVKGMSSIAAPILDGTRGEVYGAIGISETPDRITDPQKHIKARRFSGDVVGIVERTARIVSERIANQ